MSLTVAFADSQPRFRKMIDPAIIATAPPGEQARSLGGAGETVALWSSVRDRGRELSWVVSGKFALMGANAVLMLFLAEFMELHLYGLLVAAISGQLLLSRLLLMGVEAGIIRLRTLPDLHEQSRKVVQSGLWWILYSTIALGLTLLAIQLILSWTRVAYWPWWLVASIFAGAVGTALVDYNYCYRLSELQYRAAGLVQSGTSIARVVLTSAVVLLWPAYPFLIFLVYPAASLVTGLGLTAATLGTSVTQPDHLLMGRLLKFSMWLGAANMTVILSLYQGTFLLMLLKQEAETGVFGLCLTLSLGFFALYNAFGEYLLSRFARLRNPKELPRFVARAVGVALVMILACVPIAIAVGMILPKLLKPEFHGIAPTFYFLAASMLLLLLQGPLEGVCVYLLRPHRVVLGWMVRVVCAALLGVPLAANWGALGAAVAQLGAALAGLLAFAVFLIVGLRAVSQMDMALPTDVADDSVKA